MRRDWRHLRRYDGIKSVWRGWDSCHSRRRRLGWTRPRTVTGFLSEPSVSPLSLGVIHPSCSAVHSQPPTVRLPAVHRPPSIVHRPPSTIHRPPSARLAAAVSDLSISLSLSLSLSFCVVMYVPRRVVRPRVPVPAVGGGAIGSQSAGLDRHRTAAGDSLCVTRESATAARPTHGESDRREATSLQETGPAVQTGSADRG